MVILLVARFPYTMHFITVKFNVHVLMLCNKLFYYSEMFTLTNILLIHDEKNVACD